MKPFQETDSIRDPRPPVRSTTPAGASLRDAIIARGLGWTVAGIGGLALIGWALEMPLLRSLLPGQVETKANTALGFVLGGLALAARIRWRTVSTGGAVLTLGFAFALLLLGLLGGAVLRNTHLLVESNRRVVHTHEVLNHLAGILSAIQDVETGTRGYLLTGNRAFLEPYAPAAVAAREQVRQLRGLLADHPAQLERLDRLEPLIGAKLATAAEQVALRDRGEAAGAQAMVVSGEGKRLMDAIRLALAGMETAEEGLLHERLAQIETSTTKTLLTLGAGLVGSVALLVAVFVLLRREVRARTRLAADLRRSEESLAVTLNSIGDAVLATDTAGRVTLLNPIAEQLTGWRQAEARGRPVEEIFRIINEQTRAPARIPVDEVLATGEIKALANHTTLIARDGTERAIADSAAPIRDADGRVFGVVLVFRDVSVERAAEARLAAALADLASFFSLSLDFLCIAGADGWFKRASPAVTDILGWTVEEFLAAPFIEFVHPDDRDATQREVERQMVSGEKVLHFENRYRHKDGSWRVLSWRSVPQGGLMYATARDVTEARRAEERIRALNQVLGQHAAQLETANRELESFSYSVSHDLRAPLRHVQGYVEMLAREAGAGLSEKARRYLKTIADAGREMGELIDDLLAFSRMGRTEMREEEVDLAVLAREVCAVQERGCPERTIRWSLKPLPTVRGDRAMLRLVLTNLLGNAVKYTRPRPVAEIELGCAGEEEGRAVFYVRDNGAGFDMKYADKLFGVFQRLHRADEFEGTGIGLASVRRIIVRHGGRVWAEARVDAGATFSFTLQPAASGAPPAAASPS